MKEHCTAKDDTAPSNGTQLLTNSASNGSNGAAGTGAASGAIVPAVPIHELPTLHVDVGYSVVDPNEDVISYGSRLDSSNARDPVQRSRPLVISPGPPVPPWRRLLQATCRPAHSRVLTPHDGRDASKSASTRNDGDCVRVRADAICAYLNSLYLPEAQEQDLLEPFGDSRVQGIINATAALQLHAVHPTTSAIYQRESTRQRTARSARHSRRVRSGRRWRTDLRRHHWEMQTKIYHRRPLAAVI